MDLRQQSLKTIFIKYLLTVIVSLLLVLGLSSGIFNALVGWGVIRSANHDEKIAYELKQQLEGNAFLRTEDFESKCLYALFDQDGKLTHTNIDDLSHLKAYQEGSKQQKRYYVTIKGKNNDAIIEYQLEAKYSKPFLQKYFPSVERVYFISLVGAMIITIIIISSSYGKKLKKALQPLEEAVRAIEAYDLDFEVDKSAIKEFQEIGQSLQSMKEALKEALVMGWLLEKKKGEQMAALAHDVKTPLTIIKSSAELLEEDEQLDEEQHMLSMSIRRNSDKIHEYIKVLMSISNEGIQEELHEACIEFNAFLEEVVEQAEQLARIKQITIDFKPTPEAMHVRIDSQLFHRACMNIISNAIEYTPAGGKVSLKLQKIDNQIAIHIVDEGIGFTKEVIVKGCKAFYMGDQSRHHKGHYGMGLYIAKQIITRHKGTLTIQNHEDGKGGEVIITLP